MIGFDDLEIEIEKKKKKIKDDSKAFRLRNWKDGVGHIKM